jgi:hypothetical protein
MKATCAVLTTMLLLGGILLLLEPLAFLAPSARSLLVQYLWPLLGVGVVVFLNVFAVLFLCGRRLFLSDTGRKLAHVEKQLRTGDAVLRDLSARLAREE